MDKKDLQPKLVFDCFAQINRVPRPSKHEDQMAAFLKAFGEGLGLRTKVDAAGNVAISKPATPGLEHLCPVVLQSHMDMVCEKNADVQFDFMKDAIQTYIDGDWLKARGTTLGADDGIGCAMEMAILQDDSVEHGPLQCVFTRDEETGLTGAAAMEPGFMEGDYLINLDSEDEGQIFVSCAGGANTVAEFPFTTAPVAPDAYAFRLTIKGLTGGHSGDDINKNRANANKLLVRFLTDEMQKTSLRLCDIQSGGLHNAIPREGTAVAVVPATFRDQLAADLNAYRADVEEEYTATEKGITMELETADVPDVAQEEEECRRMLLALRAVHNGVFAMSQTIPGFVETSSNLASIRLQGGVVVVVTSQRSSLASARANVSAAVRAAFTLGGATKVETGEGYPGWSTDPASPLVRATVESYKRVMAGREPVVLGIHAGLECGLFSVKYPHMDMVSFGPTLRGVHSPDERLLIPTVQMVWNHLTDLLKHLPSD